MPTISVLRSDGDGSFSTEVKIPERIHSHGITYEVEKRAWQVNSGVFIRVRNDAGETRLIRLATQLDNAGTVLLEKERHLFSILHSRFLPKLIEEDDLNVPYSESIPFVVFETFDHSLADLIEKAGGQPGAFSLTRIVSIGRKICSGLNYLHSKGFAALDVRPSNLFFVGNRIVIGDLSSASESGLDHHPSVRTRLDNSFLSPELLQLIYGAQVKVDFRSDIWQAGAVLWTLFSGSPPRGVLEPEHDRTGGRLFRVLRKALYANPNKRYQSARQLSRALARLIKFGEQSETMNV